LKFDRVTGTGIKITREQSTESLKVKDKLFSKLLNF